MLQSGVRYIGHVNIGHIYAAMIGRKTNTTYLSNMVKQLVKGIPVLRSFRGRPRKENECPSTFVSSVIDTSSMSGS